MKVVFGLGNPGEQYRDTRHNVGFRTVDKMAAFFQTKLRKRCFRLYRYSYVNDGVLVQPLTFMNESGNVVKYFNKDDDIVVICDNMDLACGGLRIRRGGGNSGQKGLASISEALGRSDFVRIYIGIGRPPEDIGVGDYVLGTEKRDLYRDALEKAVADASSAAIRYIKGESLEALQCEFNRKGLL